LTKGVPKRIYPFIFSVTWTNRKYQKNRQNK
jgi:hypothetical protein